MDKTIYELRKLRRDELIEIIYELKQENIKLKAENEKLRSISIRVENAGSLAEVAGQVSGILSAAQKTADLYLEALKKENEKE